MYFMRENWILLVVITNLISLGKASNFWVSSKSGLNYLLFSSFFLFPNKIRKKFIGRQTYFFLA